MFTSVSTTSGPNFMSNVTRRDFLRAYQREPGIFCHLINVTLRKCRIECMVRLDMNLCKVTGFYEEVTLRTQHMRTFSYTGI